MQNFILNCPTTVLFGRNSVEHLAAQCEKRQVKNVLSLYGQGSIKKNGVYEAVKKQLEKSQVTIYELGGVDPNPRLTTVLEGAKICQEKSIDLILAVGGGSVIDCAKGISLAAAYQGDDFWADIFKKNKVGEIKKAICVATVLTLAATGSEMNSGLVITNLATKEKLSTGSTLVIPEFSILDPTYTLSVSKAQIAAGIVDAFSHSLEQYFSANDDAIVSDNILVSIMQTLIEIAPTVIDKPNDYPSHANLMWSATMALNRVSGVGKAGDWATHDIEHAVSAYYDVTHGVGLAILFPYWMRYVLDEKNAYRFKRLSTLFQITDSDEMNIAQKTIAAIRDFFTSLGMPASLKEVGVQKEKIDQMVTSALAGSSSNTIGNFKILKEADIKHILLSAF